MTLKFGTITRHGYMRIQKALSTKIYHLATLSQEVVRFQNSGVLIRMIGGLGIKR